jgi:hypothetical protein
MCQFNDRRHFRRHWDRHEDHCDRRGVAVRRATRELHVRVTEEEYQAVHDLADSLHLPASGAHRLALIRGLAREAVEPTARPGRGRSEGAAASEDRAYQAALAALLASEHCLLMLVEIATNGAERAARVADGAGPAAQRRLARIAASLPPGRDGA